MIKKLLLPLLGICTLSFNPSVSASEENVNNEVLRINYNGFTVWLDCEQRSPVMYFYIAYKDSGDEKRASKFFLDKNIPEQCQQKSTKSYSKSIVKTHFNRLGINDYSDFDIAYDRGHMVPANHFDGSKKAIYQTNYMTNILPQSAAMNRGSMYQTELITECYRDINTLKVMGGPIWEGDASNDFFINSHGVKTPEAYWKVIIAPDAVISWIIPNTKEAVASNLDSYLVSIKDIERKAGVEIPVDSADLKTVKPSSSWPIPASCNKG
jgi:endonuclease G